MAKRPITSIHVKNTIIANITDAIASRSHFLILGHQNADDDCIASMISLALVRKMFSRDATLYLGGKLSDRFAFLLDVCRYNGIPVLQPGTGLPQNIDTVAVCDTPKPSMIEAGPDGASLLARTGILRIEIDHHIGGDSDYFGEDGYCLVTEASSASELIGHLLLKLARRTDLIERYQITEIFPRNVVLAILTGIIGDSQMGRFLTTRRQVRYYGIFSSMFNDLLTRKTVKRTNFFSMEEVFNELQALSTSQEKCYRAFMERKRFSASVGWVALGDGEMTKLFATFDGETIIATARLAADKLAEESGRLGLVAYRDNPAVNDLVQFRIRRSSTYKKYDLRLILTLFSIEAGGGHEGAIGFRIPRAGVPDLDAYVERLVTGIEAALPP